MKDDLKSRIKRMVVDHLMLDIAPEDIGDEDPLFGSEGLGLDSVDALQLVVALEKQFQLKIANPEAARDILANVVSMEKAILEHEA